jgi:hypothetical protein
METEGGTDKRKKYAMILSNLIRQQSLLKEGNWDKENYLKGTYISIITLNLRTLLLSRTTSPPAY